jgi:mannose-6-phosphate isomerase-like protein (cupin superfamily)
MRSSKPPKPLVLSANDIKNAPLETFPDSESSGTVSWKTLISAPHTATDTFTVGIATCSPGSSSHCRGHLKSHRHSQAEIYYVTQGEGTVSVEGVEYLVERGSVVWIPGDAEHGVVNTGEEDLVWLYAFAVNGFGEVVYRFGEVGKVGAKAKL